MQCSTSTGQTATKDFTITIDNPVPALTSLDPAAAPAGGPAFTLIVDGSNFVSGSAVYWNGTSRATTFVSATQLKAAITAADVATAGSANVNVVSPTPGGGPSNVLAFTITGSSGDNGGGGGGGGGTEPPELSSGELLATALVPLAAILLYRRRRRR